MVFPALGGETMRPLWPIPIGAIISITLVDSFLGSVSRVTCTLGKTGVNLSYPNLFFALSGSNSFTVSTRIKPKYLSPSFGGLTLPVTKSPVRKLNLLICDCET